MPITDRALEALEAYHWPGNIRELANVIKQAVVLTQSNSIEQMDLPASIAKSGKDSTYPHNSKSITIPLGTRGSDRAASHLGNTQNDGWRQGVGCEATWYLVVDHLSKVGKGLEVPVRFSRNLIRNSCFG